MRQARDRLKTRPWKNQKAQATEPKAAPLPHVISPVSLQPGEITLVTPVKNEPVAFPWGFVNNALQWAAILALSLSVLV